MTKPIILLDMDAVLFDFHNGLRDRVLEDARVNVYDSHIPVEFETWSLFTGDENTDKAISTALNSDGFFAELQPMPGAVEAVEYLQDRADVFFCSTPFHTNPHCLQDKATSLNKAFGDGASKKMILTSDKTVVYGDILVDDRPDVVGALTEPHWVQVFYNHLYNKQEAGPRIYEWDERACDFILGNARAVAESRKIQFSGLPF